CGNHGQCYPVENDVTKIHCECDSGWYGQFCDRQVDLEHPCRSNTTCAINSICRHCQYGIGHFGFNLDTLLLAKTDTEVESTNAVVSIASRKYIRVDLDLLFYRNV
ncbi:unnamed protein product, partial [Rotaria sp. Silwood2]